VRKYIERWFPADFGLANLPLPGSRKRGEGKNSNGYMKNWGWQGCAKVGRNVDRNDDIG
jgi:hypothetical protein